MGILDTINRWLTDNPDDPEDSEGIVSSDASRDYSRRKTTVSYTLMIEKPKKYEDASRLADRLKYGDALIISLAELSKEESQRLVDFLTGVVMARDGMIRKISGDILVCTPEDIKVVVDK